MRAAPCRANRGRAGEGLLGGWLALVVLVWAVAMGPPAVAAAGREAAVGAPALAEEPAPATLGIGLLDRPVSADGDVRAERYIVDHVAPGATFSRRLVVANNTEETLRVATSVSGASVRDGAFSFEPSGPADELAEWVRLSRPALSLRPGVKAVLRATVAVPEDATAGERYGVIWAATRAPGAGGVDVVSRVGIRIYLSVGEGGEPASDFGGTDLRGGRTSDGRPFVQATVENTGGRAVDVAGELMLTDRPASLAAGPFAAAKVVTLAPGESAPLTALLDSELPAGPWHARLTLTSGRVQRSIEGSVSFPGGSAAAAGAPSSLWPEPSYLATGAGTIAVALLLLLLARRRQRAEASA